MPKNLIMMEDGNSYQFDSEEELVKALICEDYYSLIDDEKNEKLKMCAISNSLNFKHEKSFDFSSERNFILSLLIDNKNLYILEKIGSNIFINDKSFFNEDEPESPNEYINVNAYAKEILESK